MAALALTLTPLEGFNMALPPGLLGFQMARQQQAQEQAQGLNQLQGLLGVQQSQIQQGLLQQQLSDKQRQQANIDNFAQSLPAGERPRFMIDPTGYMKGMSPEYKDLGGSIGVIRSGQLVGTIPKTASPDAVLSNEGQNFRHQNPSGSAIIGAQTTMRGQDLSHQIGLGNLGVARGNLDVSRQRLELDARKPTGTYDQARGMWVSGGFAKPVVESGTGKPIGPKTGGDINTTLNLYVAARNGLLSGLERAATGPVAGMIPAMTTDAQVAEGGVSAMAPVLKQIFRVAGEGTFTDKDQELLLGMVPTRKDTAAARADKIRNIDNIIGAKLGLSVPAFGAQSGATSGWSIQKVD